MSTDRRQTPPRAYARQIVTLGSIEERRAALLDVPEDWRALVRKHVEIAWNHPKGNKTCQ
ncbi:hypothetical protein D3C85_1563850 [compost metagenome]